MKKKKGSALIITICVMSLMIVMAASLLATTVSNNILTSKYDNINRAKMIAESGIEKAFAYVKYSISESYPILKLDNDNLIDNVKKNLISNIKDFSFREDNLFCSVTYNEVAGEPDIIEIVSNGQTLNNTTHKKVTVDIDLKTLCDNNSSNMVSDNALTAVDEINDDSKCDSVKSNKDDILNIKGSSYFQGNKVDITPVMGNIEGDITVKGNEFFFKKVSFEDPDNDFVKTQNFLNLFSSSSFSSFKGSINYDVQNKDGSTIDPESFGWEWFNKYIFYKGASYNNISIKNKLIMSVKKNDGAKIRVIDNPLNNREHVVLYYEDGTAINGGGKLSEIINNINNDPIARDYANDYKVILYNGDLTIDDNNSYVNLLKLDNIKDYIVETIDSNDYENNIENVDYNKCLIYCTGKITVGNDKVYNVGHYSYKFKFSDFSAKRQYIIDRTIKCNMIKMTESSILGKNIELGQDTKFDIQYPKDDFNDDIKQEVKRIMAENIDGYYDNISAAITSWKEN